MSQITNAVAVRDNGPQALIHQYRGDFTTVLPSHIKADTWVRLAQGVLRRDENLAKAAQRNPASFMAALLECARLGHEPGTESFYLVPFGNEVQGIEGYRGVVERMYRAGKVDSVMAELVYSGDRFHYQPGMTQPDHEVDWFGDRGEIVGAYAYAEFTSGRKSRVAVINQAYVARVRAESRGSDRATSPWKKWPESMVLKTVAKRLEPWVPTSTEWMREQLRAVRDVAAEKPQPRSLPQQVPPPAPTAPQPAPEGPDEQEPVYEAEFVDDGADS